MPARRSTAQGLQIFISFALGAAGSPYLIGAVSDAIKPSLAKGDMNDLHQDLASLSARQLEFDSLGYSLYMAYIVEVLGGLFFLLTAIYVVKDKEDCDAVIRAENDKTGGEKEALNL